VSVQELKAEMMEVMRWVLTDLAKREQDLKITKVEENLVLTMMHDGEKGDADKQEIYYDVTVVRHSYKNFGPMIIAGLRTDYDDILKHILDSFGMKYFVFGVDFIWCTDNGEEETNSFEMCSMTYETVTVDARLANIPQELDMEKLSDQMVLIYKFMLKGVKRLDIASIEKNIVNVTTDGEGNDTKDIYFDIQHVRKFGMSSFEPMINARLQNSKDDILDNIQRYTDAETDLGFEWYIDSMGSYAIKPEPKEEPVELFVLPNWAIITITVVSATFVFCCCWCITAFIKKREEMKNEMYMASYLEGQNYGKPARPRPPPTWQTRSRQPQRQHKRHRIDSRHRRRKNKQRERKHKKRRKASSNHVSNHMSNHHHHRSTRQLAIYEEGGVRNTHQIPRNEIGLQLKHAPSFVTENDDFIDNSPKYPTHRKDTEFQLKHMPSFVFDNNEGFNHPTPQQQHFTITKGEDCSEDLSPAPDPDGNRASLVIAKKSEYKSLYVDEESLLTE